MYYLCTSELVLTHMIAIHSCCYSNRAQYDWPCTCRCRQSWLLLIWRTWQEQHALTRDGQYIDIIEYRDIESPR